MADPIQINLYIKSLGLTGKEADLKRKELEKLSNEELKLLISGKKVSNDTQPWEKEYLIKKTENNNQFFEFKTDNGIMGWRPQEENLPAVEKKIYKTYEKRELREFAGEFIYNSTLNAKTEIENFNNGIGFISLQNGVNNFKSLIGTETSHEFEKRLSKELDNAKVLKNLAPHEGKFEYQFEKDRKIEFNPANIENLKKKTEEYTRLTAFQEKYENLNAGLKHIKILYAKENALETAKERGQIVPEQKSTFEEEFVKILDEFCGGNEELRNEYIKKISSGITNRKELKEHFIECLERLEKECKKELQKEFGGKTYEQHTKEYNEICKKAIGSENAENMARNYIENAKKYATYAEIGTTIALSLLLPGSSLVSTTGKKLTLKFGQKAAGYLKAGLTGTMASIPAGITAIDAATSKNGFTEEKKSEIIAKWKNGLFYGGLGAYVSGPIGNSVEALLKTKPNVIASTIQKAFNGKGLNTAAKASGITAETTADVVLDMITQNGDIISSLQTNGGMNIGMMLVGGRLSKAFSKNNPNILIQKQTDGSYVLKDSNGKLLFKANDENILATFLLGKAIENSGNEPAKAAGNANITMDNPGALAAKKLQDKVGLKLDNKRTGQGFPKAPIKYNTPNKGLLNVLKHFNPEVMEAHYAQIGNRINDVIKNHSSELKSLSNNFEINKQAFSEKIVEILSNEFGLKGLEPPIRFGDTGSDDGYWDWTRAEILINKNINTPEDIVKMLSHEFQHVIQYKDILTKYGKNGLIMLCKTGENPQETYNTTINLPYTQKLLHFAKENPYAKNGLNDYMSRIYTDEMQNYKDSDNPEYTNQIVEQEAYYLGNNRSNQAYSENVIGNNDNSVKNTIANLKAKLKKGEPLNNSTTIDDKINSNIEQNYTIDEFGQIQHNTPAGNVNPNNPIKPIKTYADENGISQYMMKKYIELGKITLTPDGKIDSRNPDNIKFVEELNRPSLITKEELSAILGISERSLPELVRSGKLVQDISNKYDIENEQNKKYITEKTTEKDENIITRGRLGKTLGINIHSIDYHIQQGHLRVNADGKIDLTDELNKNFVENFQKGEKQKRKPKPVTDKNIQDILGDLPLEYCIEHKFLITDENGKIDYDAEQNKTFIEKFKNKELTVKDFFVSVAEFARRNGNSETTIIRAISNGKIVVDDKGRIDINNPVNKEYSEGITQKEQNRNNPNYKTVAELVDLLGFANYASVYYHLKNKRLVKNENGFIDISVEPNKSFIESIQNGTYEKQKQVSTPSKEKPVTEDNSNAVYKTQTEIALEKGLTQATINFHVARGHLITSGRGKIDINNPINAYFMKNFKKGEKFIPYEDSLPKAENTPAGIQDKINEINPNMVTLKEFAAMTGLTTTPILYHIDKGRAIRGEDGKIDITNPTNRKFIQKYNDAVESKFTQMSTEHLNEEKSRLQRKLVPLLSREIYINANEMLKFSQDKFDSYIQYTTRRLINTENLSNNQTEALYTIIKEIITSRINNKSLPENFSDVGLVSLSTRFEIDGYQALLNRISKPDKPIRTIKSELTDKGFELQIEPDEAFDEFLSNIKEEFGEKINIIKLMQDSKQYPTSRLVDNYLYNKYLSLKIQGKDIVNEFIKNLELSSGNNLINLNKINVENFVENILYKNKKIPQNDPEFEKFKKHFDYKKLTEIIEKIKSEYKNKFYTSTCTENALNLLQEANPFVPVTRENLTAVINDKLGIESSTKDMKYLIETAKYKDRTGRRTPIETEIREYIEVFHTVEHVNTYNSLVQLYNKYCGINRNDKIAAEFLNDLKMTDVNGKLNKDSILINEDIIKDIIKKYEKYTSINTDKEIASTKSSYNQYDIIIEEIQDLVKDAGFPDSENINTSNLKQAELFIDIIENYEKDVDIDSINSVLTAIKENFKGNTSDIAEIYFAEPIRNRNKLIDSLKTPAGIEALKQKLELYNRWKYNMPEDLDINSYEYYNLTDKMGLKPEQIYSKQTNIFKVLNIENYDDLENLLNSSVQVESNKKMRLIYQAFGQKNIDGLKEYFDSHNIDDFKIKHSLISRNSIKNFQKFINNNPALYSISINFKNKNTTLTKSFDEICKIFENLNGKITLKEGDGAAYTDTAPQNIIAELKKKVSHNTHKNETFNNTTEYKNIFKLLGIDTQNMSPREISYTLDNLTTKQQEILEQISTVLSSPNFDEMMTSIHGKMRFLERFILKDKIDIKNKVEYEAYIDYFIKMIRTHLNKNVTIEVFQSGTDGGKIAPKIKFNDEGITYTITLDDRHKIHTIF